MEKIFVSDLVLNQEFISSFLVSRKEIKSKKNGGDYLHLKLTDRSGTMTGFLWDNIEEYKESFRENDYVKVKAQVREFNGNLQLTVFKIKRQDDADVDPADYLPVSPNDPEAQFAVLKGHIDSMQNADLRKLMEIVFSNAALTDRFKKAPAAKRLHHAWLGGLLDHTLSLVELCRGIAAHYPQLNADLLMAGAILHDIGKIEEYQYARSLETTDEGRLLGHIVMEASFINQLINQVDDFPQELRLHLLHILISHHGQMEFGSPKEPMTPEALALHYLDDLDSKMEMMRTAIAEDPTGQSPWSAFHPFLERHVYRRRVE